jgi:hypothetical protein
MSAADQGSSFLRYLESLDAFLATRLDHDDDLRQDPDVARLIESVAYFSQHAAKQASASIHDTVRELATGPFESFDRPLPAQVFVSAGQDSQRLAPLDFPAGTTFELSDNNQNRAIYASTRPLRILPIRLEHGQMRPSPQGNLRIVLRFRSRVPVDLSGETIALQVLSVNDAGASLRLVFLLRRHLRSIRLLQKEEPSVWDQGEPCGYAFEDPHASHHAAASLGPFDDLRRVLAQPLHLCGLRITLPPFESRAETFELRLELDEAWPNEEIVSARNFALHCVPLENRFPGVAAPIFCDGTQKEFDIVALQPADAVLHHIVGVYEGTKNGPEWLPPAHVATSNRWWTKRKSGGDPWESVDRLHVHLPRAFLRPVPITVQGQWMQPATCSRMHGPLRVRLYESAVEGLAWQTILPPTRSRPSPAGQQPDRVLQAMAWRSRRFLPLAGLRSIVRLLGIHDDHPCAPLLDVLVDIRGEEVHDPQSGSPRLDVQITCGDFADDDLGLMCLLLLVVSHVHRVWSPIPVSLTLTGTTSRRLAFAARDVDNDVESYADANHHGGSQ